MTMNKTLKYIGISHKTASVEQREMFHISEREMEILLETISNTFSDVSGLFILATCNRTEIYFESTLTSASKLRDYVIIHKVKDYDKSIVNYFICSDSTEETARHLLDVASGLDSLVLGDAEIVHQIKKAYQFSVAHKTQGSLLERVLQSIFKSHKRISNETHFRDGTTSVAYKSLKVIRSTFGKTGAQSKNILFIGAGDIVKQLFKYNSKFNFGNIYISNRTAEKAKALSKSYNCKTYEWNKVINNDFEKFDVIISAVGNCHHFIKEVPQTAKKLLLIDLAIPGNIDKASVQGNNIVFYDLDLISVDLEETKEKRLAAIDEVDIIISEEFAHFKKWLEDATLRE
ncbi:MAG TPA: glutamyl-tRNA reductase, partial [Flavobacteriaceae bacterium]|nr:glutamyl-tRNA reductase [Flavobacteriaceae bacterium]